MSVFCVEIVRKRDKMPLISSIEGDVPHSELKPFIYSNIIKWNQDPPFRTRVEAKNTVNYLFYYDNLIGYLVTDKFFPADKALECIETIVRDFSDEYKGTTNAIENPSYFLEYQTKLQSFVDRAQKSVSDSSMQQLNAELGNVKSSMTENIRKAIDRQGLLEDIGGMAEKLHENSGVFADIATDLNQKHYWRTYGRPVTVLSIVALVYLMVSLLF